MMTNTNEHEVSRQRGHQLVVSLLIVTILAIAPNGAVAQTLDELRSQNWHQWRGPEASGVSRTATPPIEWSEDKNIHWKVAIDGHGSSTPIIWEDRIFLLTAVDTGIVDPSLPRPEDQPERVFGIKYPNTTYRFVVLCLDRETGRERWRRTATQRVPHEGHHGDNSFASASPTTDGERLYCWFGSAGLFCYDLDGNRLWERDLGKAYMGASLGEGASPVVHDGRLVIVRDQQRQSYIEVLDAKSGKTLWRADRDEPNAWATPCIVEYGGQTQVITAASNLVRSYDLHTGEIIWQCSGLTGNVIPSPVIENGVAYCMSGYQGYSLLALPLSATSDNSKSDATVWRMDRATPYIPSPLLYDGMLYFTQSNQAILSCVDAQTGKKIIDRTRLNGLANIYASPVGAKDRIYYTGRDGTTLVLERAKELKVLAKNHLDDEFDASPALAGNQLFLRGRSFLYCMSEDSKRKIASEALARIPALHHPGERFTYGFNTDLLGRLIEVWSGKPLDEYLRYAVLEPLEMVDTGFSIPQDKRSRFASCHTVRDGKLSIVDKAASSPFNEGFEFLSGGGGLVATVRDLAFNVKDDKVL